MSDLKDDAIQRQVEQAIGYEPRVNGFDLKVMVRDGVVRLEGIVSDFEAKRAAESAASAVPGVRRVDNTLTVEDPRGLADPQIERAVDEALASDADVDTHDVGATVKGGTAYLVGHVDSASDAAAAVDAASRAPGVKDAISEIDISPGIRVDWVDLKNLVIDALDDADDLLPYTIDVSVQTDGHVVLSGTMARESDIERAALIAGGVDGVKGVVNRLQVE